MAERTVFLSGDVMSGRGIDQVLPHVDIVHGHSSHHVKAIEVYHDRPILYGGGDFITDYEGIGGHERYRHDLVLMYLPTFDTRTQRLVRFALAPLQLRRFQLVRPPRADCRGCVTPSTANAAASATA